MIWLRLGRSGIALLLGSALAGLVLSALSPAPTARAAGTTRYVAVDGVDAGDCSAAGPGQRCRSPQYAIDQAASGDIVKIAAGVYDIAGPIAFTTTVPFSFTQIAFISKTLTVSGGYTLTDWVVADNVANLTVFDAGGAGRGVTIFGTSSEVVTVTGLTLTGGDYTGLGNPNGVFQRNCRGYQSDCGGGLYAVRVRLHASDLVVTNNIASRTRGSSPGGGLALEDTLTGSTLTRLIVANNVALGSLSYGGGIALDSVGAITISDSLIHGNSAAGQGGAIAVFSPAGPVTILNTDLILNAAGVEAPALYFETSATGSLQLEQSQVLTQASPAGDVIGIVNYGGDDDIVFRNILIAGTTVTATTPNRGLIRTNVESANGSLVRLALVHATAAGNQGLALLDVQAVPFLSNSGRFDAGMTNTLAVDLPALFQAKQGGASQVAIAASHTLTEGVPALTTGSVGTAAITLSNTVSGLPNLGPSYRPGRPSAAINAALQLGITVDAQGSARDSRADIGALEAEPLPNVHLPALLK